VEPGPITFLKPDKSFTEQEFEIASDFLISAYETVDADVLRIYAISLAHRHSYARNQPKHGRDYAHSL